MNDPILITGFQRSGTTMVTYILNNHFPKITNEAGIIDYITRDYGDKINNLVKVIEERYLHKVNYFSKIVPLPDKLEIKRIYNTLYEQKITEDLFTQDFGDFTKTTIIDKYEIKDKDFSIWGDKTTNFSSYLKPFRTIFPESKIIYIVRNGLQTVASNIRLGWGEEIDLWLKWVDEVDCFLEWQNANDNCLLIRQEDLIINPEKVCKNLSDYLGISIDINLFNSFIYKASKGESAARRTTNIDDYISMIPIKAHQIMKRLNYV